MFRLSVKLLKAMEGVYDNEKDNEAGAALILWLLESYKTNNIEKALRALDEDEDVNVEKLRYVFFRLKRAYSEVK